MKTIDDQALNKEALYSANQISKILGIKTISIRNKISRLGLEKVKSRGRFGNAVYSYDQVVKLGHKEDKTELKHKYYPLKMEVVYYIYESKMNRDE